MINLNLCTAGDQLFLRNGYSAKYQHKDKDCDHFIEYDNGQQGIRDTQGYIFSKFHQDDLDVVQIYKKYTIIYCNYKNEPVYEKIETQNIIEFINSINEKVLLVNGWIDFADIETIKSMCDS